MNAIQQQRDQNVQYNQSDPNNMAMNEMGTRNHDSPLDFIPKEWMTQFYGEHRQPPTHQTNTSTDILYDLWVNSLGNDPKQIPTIAAANQVKTSPKHSGSRNDQEAQDSQNSRNPGGWVTFNQL